ncbi:MAG: SDR family oxidoreductase [Phycisphaerales bacterium]|nr:SDR family oxidoreductase [Phycisphaerales bacterium]MCB9862303.1 SDR family oxidoreductase [Phycisphaerales bacterium]
MSNGDFRDQRIIVTGASSGIGAALARGFAAAGGHVALVARRRERLAVLASELSGGPGKGVVVEADLTEADSAGRVVAEAEAGLGGRIDVLVNNAGIGDYGAFPGTSLADIERMMTLNMNAVVRLTHAVLPGMIQRRRGHILSIASTAAFQPTPHMAVYGATKAFVLSFSMGIWAEVRKKGVGVTCVCPGPVETEFFDRGGFESRKGDFSRVAMSPERVAAEAIWALRGRRTVYVPGWKNKVGAVMQRFAPMRTVTRITGKVLGPK